MNNAAIESHADQMAAFARDEGTPLTISSVELGLLLRIAHVGYFAVVEEFLRREGRSTEGVAADLRKAVKILVDEIDLRGSPEVERARRTWGIGVHGVITACEGRVKAAGGGE